MKNAKLPLQSFRLRNFKAVRDSGAIPFTPLTAFIGNNGSGKSSIIEGLEALQTMVLHGIDDAMEPWRLFEEIRNKAVSHELQEDATGHKRAANPMSFEVDGMGESGGFHARLDVNVDAPKRPDKVVFQAYDVALAPGARSSSGKALDLWSATRLSDPRIKEFVAGWQFLSLAPHSMMYPRPQKRSADEIRLDRYGSNIAELLLSMNREQLDSILETMRTVLPFASDVRPEVTSEVERSVYLRMTEGGFTLPGWLFSQGTLRIVALLATFRQTRQPSVVFVEEVENGLDPRTIHLVVEEIRGFLDSGGQVVLTSHSPYFLDLLALSQIVVVERDAKGSPTFKRPASSRALKGWKDKFSPGKLYTMGTLTGN